jgi:Uma2 family endonuclease
MMIQTLPKVTTFEEFVEFLPENSGMRYELLSKFQNCDRIISQTFPELNLTANQIFQAGLVFDS